MSKPVTMNNVITMYAQLTVKNITSLLSHDSTIQIQSGLYILQRTLKKSILGRLLLALKYKTEK